MAIRVSAERRNGDSGAGLVYAIPLPLVDVLEGRNFLSGSAPLYVAAAPAGESAVTAGNPAEEDEVSDDGSDGASGYVMDYDGGQPHRVVRRELLGLVEPACVEVTTAAGELTFSVTEIGDGDDVLYGNMVHDRRGRALPAPAALPALPAPGRDSEDKREEPRRNVFRDGRSLGGMMQPYLTMSMPEKGAAFAA